MIKLDEEIYKMGKIFTRKTKDLSIMVKDMSNSKKDIKRYLKAYGGQKRNAIFEMINEAEQENNERQ